ncbi:hypothetical protein MASR2M70_01320 [Bacillota bacterium]
MLTIKTKAEEAGVPNILLKGFSKKDPTIDGIPTAIIKSAQIKKGSSAGKTEFAHKAIPFCADSKTAPGNAIIDSAAKEAATPAGM